MSGSGVILDRGRASDLLVAQAQTARGRSRQALRDFLNECGGKLSADVGEDGTECVAVVVPVLECPPLLEGWGVRQLMLKKPARFQYVRQVGFSEDELQLCSDTCDDRKVQELARKDAGVGAWGILQQLWALHKRDPDAVWLCSRSFGG